MFVIFADFRKAYDSVSHDVLERTMTAMGLHENDRRMAMNMIRGQSRQSITSRGLSGRTYPRNGVPQGCTASPTVFAWFLEPLLRELNASNNQKFGFKMGNITITSLAYADDLTTFSCIE